MIVGRGALFGGGGVIFGGGLYSGFYGIHLFGGEYIIH